MASYYNNEKLNIKNHWHIAQPGQTVDWSLTDQEAWESPLHIPRNWLIRITPKNEATGAWRIDANKIRISGAKGDTGYSSGTPSLKTQIGRSKVVGPGADDAVYEPYAPTGMTFTGSTGPYNGNENMYWILSGAGSLDTDWINVIDTTNIDLDDDPDSLWYGNPSTKNLTIDASGVMTDDPILSTVNVKFMSASRLNWLASLTPDYQYWNNTYALNNTALIENDYVNRNSLDAWHSVTWFDTLGIEWRAGYPANPSSYRGVGGNEVIMVVTLKDGYTVPPVTNPILVDINTEMHHYDSWVAYSAAGLPIINSSIYFDEQIIINNSSNVTITNTSNHTITQETLDGGFKNQSEKIQITGNCTNGGVIATIKIEANDNYYLSKKPSLILDLDPKINMIVKSKTKSSGKIKSYTVDIVYDNNINSGSNTTNLNLSVSPLNIRPNQIDNIIFNSNPIRSNGESRLIKIIGKPGAEFALAINENFIDTVTDVTTGEVRNITNKINDVSILSSSNYNAAYDYGYGKKLNILKGKIGKSGIYKFTQKFPSVTAFKTANTTTKSSSTDIRLSSTVGIKKNDKLYARELKTSATGAVDPTVVQSVVDGANITVSPAISITAKEGVSFKRNRQYSVDLIPEFSSTLGNNVPKTLPSFTVNQYVQPALKISIKEGLGSSFTISQFNDVATGLSAGATHDSIYLGEALVESNRLISFKYLITCGTNITDVSIPRLNNEHQYLSTWTNSVAKDNGGTKVRILNFSHTATGSTSITLTFDLKINSFGKEDVNMELDLDNVLTHA